MRRLSAVLLLLGLLAVPATGAAQEPTQQEMQQAMGHFEKGAEWYAQGEYAKAVVEFIRGNSITPNAMFLYNISLCYERLGKLDDALSAGEKASKMEGMPPEIAVRNGARVAAFRIGVSSQETADRIERDQKALAQGDGTADGTGTGTGDGTGGGSGSSPSGGGVGALGWTGVALTVAGAGLTIGGFATNSAIKNDIKSYETAAADGDRSTYESLKADIPKKQSLGRILYIAGGSAVAVGATLLLIDLMSSGEEAPATTAVFSPTPGGFTVGGLVRF